MKGEASISENSDFRADSLETVSCAKTALEDGKAQEIVTIDLAGKTTIADFMIICSGTSQRQVTALADRLIRSLKNRHQRVLGIEGYERGDWVLLDLGTVIVHIFREEVRSHYNLERMWAMPLAGPIGAAA